MAEFIRGYGAKPPMSPSLNMHKNIMKTHFSVSAKDMDPHTRILTASRYDINRALGLIKLPKF